MYESYSLAIAESSVKQNLENRLKIIDSLCLGAIWELWGSGQREAGLQGLRASRRQGWSLGHPEQGALPGVLGFPGGSAAKNPPAVPEMQDLSLSWEDPLEAEMATHPSILA